MTLPDVADSFSSAFGFARPYQGGLAAAEPVVGRYRDRLKPYQRLRVFQRPGGNESLVFRGLELTAETVDWDQKNERRLLLINKSYGEGVTEIEAGELSLLQAEFEGYLDSISPAPLFARNPPDGEQ